MSNVNTNGLFQKFFLAAVLINSFANNMQADANEPKKHYLLENEIIHIVDGIKAAMDGHAVWDIERVCFHIRRMLYGKLDRATKTFIGIFDLDDTKYSILELAKIEAQAEVDKDKILLTKLADIYAKAVHEFMVFTADYLEKSKDTKHLIIKLMEESCKKRNRENSPILTWAETNGDEEFVFKKTNKNLQAMALFFIHLNDFLGDLVHSCPKGYAQFKKLLQEKRA